MVLVGGLTRLTNSGLSITEWELFKGILPPLTIINSGIIYFFYIKKFLNIILLNNMTLEQFKIIFYWEYIHSFFRSFNWIFF